jgi:two-component system, NtrC family, response regulator AtoC
VPVQNVSIIPPVVKKLIYIVDDEPKLGELFTTVLRRDGYEARAFLHPTALLEQLDQNQAPDVIVADMMMPEMSGVELLNAVRERGFKMPYIVMTAHSSVQSAVEAMHQGAYHYLPKPVNLEEFRRLLERALSTVSGDGEISAVVPTPRPSARESKKSSRKEFSISGILGQSEPVERVRETVRTLGRVPGVSVLILGETGTGKNLVARTLHENATAGAGRFMEINCAALPDNLLEAELFGYEKGAFTDARLSKPGLLEIGDGGTVFLDEIDSMSLVLQAKLLSFLEGRTFRRLGGVEEIRVSTRVICATNANLEEKVANRQFRQDLFYRINVVSLALPALRQMGRDVILIAEHLIRQFARDFDREVQGLTPDAEQKLMEHSWAGNVRELRNVLERGVIFARGPHIDASDLMLTTAGGFEVQDDTGWMFIFPSGRTLEELERAYILHTLQGSDLSFADASLQLGISKKTLWEKRKRYQLDQELDR